MKYKKFPKEIISPITDKDGTEERIYTLYNE